MISNEESERIRKGFFTLNVIWAAMLISLFIYLYVGLFVKDTVRITMDKSIIHVLRNMLYVVSLITLIATRFIRRFVLSGQGSSTAVRANQLSYQNSQPPALARYTSAMVISLALTESIGVYGLILFFIGKNRSDLYLFILVSAAAMLFYRPKKDEILNLTEELNRQEAADQPGRAH